MIHKINAGLVSQNSNFVDICIFIGLIDKRPIPRKKNPAMILSQKPKTLGISVLLIALCNRILIAHKTNK